MTRITCGLTGAGLAIALGIGGLDGRAHPGTVGVTWTGSVSRIIERRCASCHGAGGTALPPLGDYAEARAASQAVKEAVLAGRMPRWHAVRGFGDFDNDPGLTPHEVDLIAEWADGGAPYGENAGAPASPGPEPDAPDLLLAVSSKHRIRASSHTFAVTTPFETQQWVRGWEFRPGNPSLVRGAILSLPSGETLATWVPGDHVRLLPEGIGQRLPARSTILVTIHYGQPETAAVDASRVGIYLADRADRELTHLPLACGSTRLPRGIEVLAIRPAIGSSGGALRVVAKKPGQRVEPLGWFENYAGDHPQTYWFREPPALRRGTSIEVHGAGEPCGAAIQYVASPGRRTRPAHARAAKARDVPSRAEHWCPMHPDVRSAGPGTCGRCRMPLVPTAPEVEGRYALDAELLASTLRLRVREPGTHVLVNRFETVHEQPFHLFAVSDGLNEFAHVHPESRPDGSLEVAAPVFATGSYRLFADFLPVGGTPQLIRKTIVNRGDGAPRPAPLVPDASHKTGRRLRVRLERESGEIRVGRPSFLAFVLEDPITARPVTDLEPYLGAWGHLFIVSSDLRDAVHSHPVTPLSAVGGPRIVFRQRFPVAGVYRLWAQFQRGGEVETVPFTLAVGEPPVSTPSAAAPRP